MNKGKHLPRTIWLLQNVAGKWYVRTGSSNGQKISTEESYSGRAKAREAFVTEGKHQPFANMVVLLEGHRPVTIRAGTGLPVADRNAEQILEARIDVAFELKRPTLAALPADQRKTEATAARITPAKR